LQAEKLPVGNWEARALDSMTGIGARSRHHHQSLPCAT